MKIQISAIVFLFIMSLFSLSWASLTKTQVSQLYVSLLGRASEGEGNTYWQANQSDVIACANTMMNTDAAKSYFGATLNDNYLFISFIYENTLNKTYAQDSEGIDYWVGMLNAGASRGLVVASLVAAIEDYAPGGTRYNPDDIVTVAAYKRFVNRVEVSDYMADLVEYPPDNWAVTTRLGAMGLNVTEETSSVELAKNTIDELSDEDLSEKISTNEKFYRVKEAAADLVRSGFSAGDNYGEVWIRDFNTFMDLSCDFVAQNLIREKLIHFFKFQDQNGGIVDAYVDADKIIPGAYNYIYSDLDPSLAAHKNTVETDQESSLIQAVYKYVSKTGDYDFLDVNINGLKISERMELALEFLMNYRFNQEYGLIWGGTTADWGDVQPEDEWGVNLTNSTHVALDIYDNAMFVIALLNYAELVPERASVWNPVLEDIKFNIREHLWDSSRMKFIPHIYINSSPFDEDFNENDIYYHGGTAVAIEAGILSPEEILISLHKMISNVKSAGAASVGLTMYPAYPEGSFINPLMWYPYTYQNGGDWTWFGARLIQQLVKYGFVKEAYEQILPMVDRVIDNDGFYEWYTISNEPMGSASYRGSAGVLYQAIMLLDEWAGN